MTTQTLNPTNIIFDLHGVIFGYDAQTQSPFQLPEGVEILKACANQLDQNGQNLHKLYILSNWGTTGFARLKQDFPEIINLFDGIMTSGESGYSKPSKEAFLALINKYQIQNQYCIFIDDSESNIIESNQFGWIGILYNQPNLVWQQLKTLKVID